MVRTQSVFLAVLALVSAGQRPASAQIRTASPVDTLRARVDTLLDLETVIARALSVSPAVVQGEQSMAVSQSAGRVAAGAYLPSLTASASTLRSDILSGTTPTPNIAFGNSYAAGLVSSIDVFDGGRRSAERSRTKADVHAAEATNISQRYAVTLAATRAYYEVLRGSDLVAVAQARVARADRGMRYAQDRVRAGTATKSDELRAKLELTSGRQQLLAALDTQQTATLSLGRLVGADGPVGAKPAGSLEPRALSLSDTAIIALAIATAPSVTAAEASVRASDAATRAAKSLYMPGIRLSGGYAWANESPVVSSTKPGWQLLLSTSFPLFNGFLREDAIARTDAQAEVTRATALDVRRQVRTESARLLGALRLATEGIQLALEAQAAAQEDLRVQTERYRAGISTSLDQLTSEFALTQAELGLVAARYNYQIVRASLEALVGRAL